MTRVEHLKQDIPGTPQILAESGVWMSSGRSKIKKLSRKFSSGKDASKRSIHTAIFSVKRVRKWFIERTINGFYKKHDSDKQKFSAETPTETIKTGSFSELWVWKSTKKNNIRALPRFRPIRIPIQETKSI